MKHILFTIVGLLMLTLSASVLAGSYGTYYVTTNPEYVAPVVYNGYYPHYNTYDVYYDSYFPYIPSGYAHYRAYPSYYSGYGYPYTSYPTPSYYWAFDTWNTPWVMYGYNTPYFYGSQNRTAYSDWA